VLARYSYRAVRRMQEDEQDYQAYLAASGRRPDGSREPKRHVVGVDVGGENLRVAVSAAGAPAEVVEDKEGHRVTPAYFYVADDGEHVTGRRAGSKAHRGGAEVLAAFLMEDERAMAAVLKATVPDAISRRASEAGDESSSDSSSKDDDPDAAPPPVVETVICHPSSYTASQQSVLSSAASAAGIPDPYCVASPVSAVIGAVALGHLPAESRSAACLVVDVGHADVSACVVKSDEVKATNRAFIGGKDLIDAMVSCMSSGFDGDPSLLLSDPIARQRVRDEARALLPSLSKSSRVDADLPYVTADADGPKHLKVSVSSDVLARTVDDLVGGVESTVLSLMTDSITSASMTPFDLSAVLLVGGGSLSPLYADAVRGAAGKLGGEGWAAERLKVVEGREEIVVIGAAHALE